MDTLKKVILGNQRVKIYLGAQNYTQIRINLLSVMSSYFGIHRGQFDILKFSHDFLIIL